MRLQTTSGFNESYEAFFDSCSDDSRKFSIILRCPLHFIGSPLIIFKYLSVMLLCFDLGINVASISFVSNDAGFVSAKR